MRRIASIIFLLLTGLCACKPLEDPRAPFTESRIPPGLAHRFYPPQGWAWGLVKVGKAPAVRYGVSAPPATARGQVIILPGYGEVAEAWFETARDLNAAGYVVWVLEGSSQGGSGRRSLPRDLVDARSLDPDVGTAAILAMQISRDRPRYLVAEGKASAVAVRAAALGVPLDGLILLHPDLGGGGEAAPTASTGETPWRQRIGLGGVRAPGGKGWSPEGDERLDGGETRLRQALTHRWQRANPDLRMGSPSIDWNLAYNAERRAAVAAWPKLAVPTLVVGTDVCGGKTTCRHEPEPAVSGAAGGHSAFVSQILGFIHPARGGLAPAPATATLDDQS